MSLTIHPGFPGVYGVYGIYGIYDIFALQWTQLIVSRLHKLIPLKNAGINLCKYLIDWCVRCSAKCPEEVFATRLSRSQSCSIL